MNADVCLTADQPNGVVYSTGYGFWVCDGECVGVMIHTGVTMMHSCRETFCGFCFVELPTYRYVVST